MIPDIVEIKRLCVSGQWNTKLENGKILLHDTVAGETVCIGNVDAEPVRHGRWLESNPMFKGIYQCSVCGNYSAMTNGALVDGRKDNYCPNCGAKMYEEG